MIFLVGWRCVDVRSRLREEVTLTANGSCPNGDCEVVFNGEKAFSIWCASSWIVDW